MSRSSKAAASPSASEVGVRVIGRRQVLKGMALAAGAAAVAACGGGGGGGGGQPAGGGGGGGGAPAGGGSVSFGSNFSNPGPKAAMQKVFDSFTTKTGIQVAVNTVQHETFQEQINNYLQGRPDDVFSWFAGYRMQFFAAQGLATPISDVWQKVGGNYSEPLKAASTGADGQQYFIPFYYYPWAVFYRKSLFEEKGYEIPKTLDQLRSVAARMQQDDIIPFAFANKQGWPAMGTFDILNMRINGYDFHVSLMAGKESWTDQRVKNVFQTWRELMPYHQPGALGRDWEDAAKGLVDKKAGMYLLGMFVGQQFTKEEDRADLDFFAYPEINPQFGQDSLDAPIDGFMLSKQPKNLEGSKRLLEYFATGEAQDIYLASDPNNIAAAKDANTAGYSALQKKAVELIGSAKHIAQFLDRDTRPDFASTVMIPSLKDFINNPDDIDGLTQKIENQKKSIFVG